METSASVDGLQHNLVIVAGSAGQFYVFDETTRAVVGTTALPTPPLALDSSCGPIRAAPISTPMSESSAHR
jgi:hypothetical protein